MNLKFLGHAISLFAYISGCDTFCFLNFFFNFFVFFVVVVVAISLFFKFYLFFAKWDKDFI